ncbi:MAG: hypothetical protein QM768_20640 [Agriterribacter sp.]
MATQLLSVDELLKSESQTASCIEAVITADPESDKNVIIMPYTGKEFEYSAGISIAKENIQGVQKSGQESSCCNKAYNVVTVFFKEDAIIPLNAFVKYVKGLSSQVLSTNPEGTMLPMNPNFMGKPPCRKAESHGPVTFYRDPFGRICGIKVYNYEIPLNNF